LLKLFVADVHLPKTSWKADPAQCGHISLVIIIIIIIIIIYYARSSAEQLNTKMQTQYMLSVHFLVIL